MKAKATKRKSSSGAKAHKAPAKKAPPKKAARRAAPVAKGSLRRPPKTAAVPGRPATAREPARPASRRPRGTKVKRTDRRKEFERFRGLLLEKQKELTHAYNLSKGDSRAHTDSGTEDYIDYAVSSYAKEFLLSLSEMDRKQLLLVDEALRRIDRGEYGRCQQCSEPISPKRLEVAPWARHCVRCQELEEKGLLPQYPVQIGEDDPGDEDDVAAPEEEYEGDLEREESEELEEEPLVVEERDAEEAEEE